MKQKHFIDFHKGITALVLFLFMAVFDRWENTTAWVYLALHGTYGLLWVLKSRIFPDRTWEQRTGPGYALVILGGLTLYWLGGLLIIVQDREAPPWLLAVCITLYALGIFLHFTADMQKHVALKLNPGHLIEDGLFAYSRNINYFGELLIYLGFGLLALHWLPILVIALFIAFVWWPNMRRKDQSLARYPNFALYKSRTRLFIPFLF